MMIGKFLATLTVLAGLSLPASAGSLDITAPDFGSFYWFSGTGAETVFEFDQSSSLTDISLTLAADTLVTIAVEDCCVGGDTFGLLLDGIDTAWTFIGDNGSGNFVGMWTGLLSAGTTLIDFTLTADNGIYPGEAFWLVDVEAPEVPLPASLPLLAGALGLAGTIARRRRSAA